jgi:pyruvate dehydrogenase E2 component (dihydrolipoamide acetyltransferase)
LIPSPAAAAEGTAPHCPARSAAEVRKVSMSVQFKLPELGENVESADLIKILVSAGDRIAVDQPVLELETEKATFELPSPYRGVIREIHVREGEKVQVGQTLFTVDGQEDETGAEPVAEEASTAEGASTEPQVPPAAGRSPEPEEAGEVPGRPQPAVRPAGEPAVEASEDEALHPIVPASPTVRRLARELGIAIERVKGSGPAGRILEEDVKAHAKRMLAGAGERRTSEGYVGKPLPDFSRWGEIERRDMSGIRRTIAASMSASWSAIPHVTQFDSADITELEGLRARFGGEIEAAGGKLTITSIAVKVVASALKVFPHFAASVDMEHRQVVIKKYCHIGVAVDTDRGLIVPVLRDVDKKNILELSIELMAIAERARTKKITLEELEGAVFTLTNLGGIGGTQFTPIIHAPEVAILGISRSRREPVWVNDRFTPRILLPLSLSYDHRLIDGADAARFLRWIAQALEQPFLLPLEG